MESRLWNLTPYELARTPHAIVAEGVIHTTGRLLESELQCPICLQVLTNTRTTKDCLHRFCEECIEKALRNGNKECPSCRTKLISMRSLRPDPRFDSIIRAIFPEKFEAGHGLASNSKRNSDVRGGTEIRNRLTNGPPRPMTSSSTDPLVPLEISPYTKKVQHCAYLLKNWHPRRRLLKVTSSAAGSHVCRYILSRLIVENQAASSVDVSALDISGMELFVRPSKDKYILITNLRSSLKDIHAIHWNIARPMQLYFGFKDDFRLDSPPV